MDETNTATVELVADINPGSLGSTPQNFTPFGIEAPVDLELVGTPENDLLVGGAGNDTLIGGPGNDVLIGGRGEDRFVYQAPDEGIDTIVAFTPNEDLLVINASAFGGGLEAGEDLTVTQLVAAEAPVATGTHGQFLYDKATGALHWDHDGAGGYDPVHLANLTGAPLLTASDFNLV